MRVGEMALPFAGYGTRCISWGRTRELTTVVWVWESWQADQVRYFWTQTRALNLSTPTSTPLMNYWSRFQGQSYRFKTTGFL